MTSLDVRVGENELLSRFIFEKKHIDSVNGRARRGLFRTGPARELSVFRTSAMPETEIWEIARTHVDPGRNAPAIARAEFAAGVPMEFGLAVVSDEPPPRHACVAGWPPGDTDDEVAALHDLQHRLAEATRVTIRS